MVGVLYINDKPFAEAVATHLQDFLEDTGDLPVIDDCAKERSITLNIVSVNKLALYSLIYGKTISNNWLKMHGGVMIRRGGKRKC